MTTKSVLLNQFIQYLEDLPDDRRTAGQRHAQPLVLMIVLLATMSGYLGYRAIGSFIQKHRSELMTLFQLQKARLPSFSTVRRVLMQLPPTSFQQAYEQWLVAVRTAKADTTTDCPEQGQWHAIDGKAIRGANRLSEAEYTHLVSIFSVFDKVVVHSDKVSQKTNEIPCVQELIEASDLQGVIFTIDALHCQKKQPLQL